VWAGVLCCPKLGAAGGRKTTTRSDGCDAARSSCPSTRLAETGVLTSAYLVRSVPQSQWCERMWAGAGPNLHSDGAGTVHSFSGVFFLFCPFKKQFSQIDLRNNFNI
jgi:hypothetical protein